jgi:SAM-dependent methyltransferase
VNEKRVLEKIEILSVALIDQNRPQVEDLKRLARSLGIGLGWHYLLDWAWILSQLGEVRGMQLLDAGAGQGLLQWYLAGHGAKVLSVDRASRADLSLRFRARYRIQGLRPQDLSPAVQVISLNLKHASGAASKVVGAVRGMGGLLQSTFPKSASGVVVLYNQDLQCLSLVADHSQDAVVAVSALEHNTPQELEQVVEELMRVLKPGGLLLATLGASRDEDWFHQPSHGWCYTEATLHRIFQLTGGVPSNYNCYDELFASLRECAELRDNLAEFYYHSGDNGMPWGKWDPQYQPVGVCKIKG